MKTLDNTVTDMRDQPAVGDYHGCGRAWVAVAEGKIVAIRYMGDHCGVLTGYSPEAQAAAQVSRYCPAACRAADWLNDQYFCRWRQQAKRELDQLGTVVSGTMSCYEFIS